MNKPFSIETIITSYRYYDEEGNLKAYANLIGTGYKDDNLAKPVVDIYGPPAGDYRVSDIPHYNRALEYCDQLKSKLEKNVGKTLTCRRANAWKHNRRIYYMNGTIGYDLVQDGNSQDVMFTLSTEDDSYLSSYELTIEYKTKFRAIIVEHLKLIQSKFERLSPEKFKEFWNKQKFPDSLNVIRLHSHATSKAAVASYIKSR